MSRKPFVVIGASGQVAQALGDAARARGITLVLAGRPRTDIADLTSLSALFAELRPELVINAAAYTAVDKAETELDAARATNEEGPARLAVLCEATGAALVHLSTDYVFDGRKRLPYREDDICAPINIYGLTKAAGEDAIRRVLPRHIILRTAWVYGPAGQNFLKTMLRLGQERDVVRVVADQCGTPTSADDLARVILDVAPQVAVAKASAPLWGTYHVTALGETTWHGFAAEIFACAARAGIRVPKLEAIATKDYPTVAARPMYSVLDTAKIRGVFGVALPQWQDRVGPCVQRLAQQ